MDSTVAADILAAANQILPIRECIFLADKGYDVRDLYNTVRDVYDGEAVIPLNKRSTKKSKKLALQRYMNAFLVTMMEMATATASSIRSKCWKPTPKNMAL